MEDSRFIKIFRIVTLGGILFVIPFFVSGYDDITTHPALTQEVLNFYNKSYTYEQISYDDIQEVIQGSKDEDSGTRWLYHFYDPVYERGLVLKGSLSTEELGLAFVAGSPKSEWKSSKEWAENTLLQGDREYSLTAGILTNLFTSDDDYSWERAIYDYAWKDKKRGLRGLGHILHLLEDATVPDHTRNDPHPPVLDMGSPYEGWTKKFNRTTITIKTLGERPIEFSNLPIYFDSLASYSNNNYFSKDSICDNEYRKPIADFEKTEILSDGKSYIFGYRRASTQDVYRLFIRSADSDWVKIVEKRYGDCPLFIVDNDKLVLNDYWSRLSKQAVLHGAGAVKLFFDEVAKEKQTKALYNKNRSWITKTTEKVVGGVKNAFGSVSTRITGAYDNMAGIFFGGEDGATTQETNTEPQPPQEPTIAPTPSPTAQTPAPSAPARTNTGNTTQNQSNIQPKTSVIPIASPPPSQNTSPFLPIAGVGGAPPKEKSPSDETAIALAPQIVEAGTTTASTTATTTPPSVESPVYIASPIILEPTASTSIFGTTTLSFIGTAEPNRIIREIITSASTTSDVLGAWMLTLFSLPEGTTTLTFFAEDSGGHISSGTPRIIFIYLPEATSSPPDDTPPPRAPAGPMPGPLVGDIAEIPMLYSPRSLVITNDGARALIADGNRISELDLANGSVRVVTAGIKNPTRMAIEATGETALVLESENSEFTVDYSGRLIRVNLLTGEKTVLATGLKGPHGIAIEREGETALVRANGIYRVDLLTGSTTLIAYTAINGDIAIAADGASAFFLDEELYRGIGVIKKIDLATNEVTTVAGPFEGSIRGDALEVSPDGTFALAVVAGGDTGIKKIDLLTGEESYLFSPGAAMFGSYGIFDIALSLDAKEVLFWWVSPLDGVMLSRINLENREFRTMARARMPRAIAITQGGDSIIAASQAYFGWYFDRVELASGIGTRLPGYAESAVSFALFPDDTEIVTTNTSYYFEYSVKRINLTTGLVSTIVAELPSQGIRVVIEQNSETVLISAIGKLLRVNLATGETTVISDSIDGAGPIAIEKSGTSALLAIPNGPATELLRVDLTSSTTPEYIANTDVSVAPVGIAVDPDGESAVVAFTDALIRVNLATGETTTILSMLCEEASIRTMALESAGETVLVTHDTCGLVRVRVK